jgi:hypothetical protein
MATPNRRKRGFPIDRCVIPGTWVLGGFILLQARPYFNAARTGVDGPGILAI